MASEDKSHLLKKLKRKGGCPLYLFQGANKYQARPDNYIGSLSQKENI